MTKNINLNAGGNININKSTTVVTSNINLPNVAFNSSTGTWQSLGNTLTTISSVAPTHEPYFRG